MANRLKNEVSLEINGNKYTARPTFEALAAIEEEAGTSIASLVYTASGGSMALAVMKSILYETIKAHGEGVDVKQLEEDLVNGGLQNGIIAALSVIMTAFNGPKELEEDDTKKK